MSSYNIEVKKSWWRQKWYIVVIADNGNKIMHSENYANHKDAVEVAEHIASGTFIVVDNN